MNDERWARLWGDVMGVKVDTVGGTWMYHLGIGADRPVPACDAVAVEALAMKSFGQWSVSRRVDGSWSALVVPAMRVMDEYEALDHTPTLALAEAMALARGIPE